MQTTLSFGQFQATSSRSRWFFISFAGWVGNGSVRCQVVQSLKARLSVQTVNICSKYLEVISRESEFLISIIDHRNQLSTAIQGRIQDDDSSLYAEGGRRKTSSFREKICQNYPELTALTCRWTHLHCWTWVCLP